MSVKEQELIDRLNEIVEGVKQISIQSVEEEHRHAFGIFRQQLLSTAMWFKRFMEYKDYSASVNAAFALGKFVAIPWPFPIAVLQPTLTTLSELADQMWDAIRSNPKH